MWSLNMFRLIALLSPMVLRLFLAGAALLLTQLGHMRAVSAQPALMLPADYASHLLPPPWRASFPYRPAFGSLCSLAPLACALIDRPFAFNARLDLFVRPGAPDGTTSLLLPFSASVPLLGRAEVGLGSCYTAFLTGSSNGDPSSAIPLAQRPSGLCPFWLAGKFLIFPWFRDPHTHPALAVEYQGEYQAGPFAGLNQLGLPGPLSKVSLSYRHPLGGLELSGAASVLVDHTTHAGTVQLGGHVGYRLPVGEHFWIFAQALAQVPSFGPSIPAAQAGQTINLAPPLAGTLVVGAQQRADFGLGVGLSLMLTKSELETRVDVLFRLLSFEVGPHIKPLIPARPKTEEVPKGEPRVVPPAVPDFCPPGQPAASHCVPAPPQKPVQERLPGSPCYLYSEDGKEQMEMGHIDSTGHFCDWDGLHLPLGAVIPPDAPEALALAPRAAPPAGSAPVAAGPPRARRAALKKPSGPLVVLPATRPAEAAAAPALAPRSGEPVRAGSASCALPALWRREGPLARGFIDGAIEACEHSEQIIEAVQEHGPLVVLPRPQDVKDWWVETKEQCLDRLGPCIRDKAQAARAELNRFRRMSWEEKQYQLGKLGFEVVEQAVINAALPGGGAATGTGVRVAEGAAEKQIVKAAERKLEKEAAVHASEAAAKKAAEEAAAAEAKHAAETEAKRAAEAQAAGAQAQQYVPRDADGSPLPLPRGPHGELLPSTPDPHTQIGWRDGRKGGYRQTREFGENGKPVKDTDWTDHGRPKQHQSPHDHPWEDNPTGGTPRRGN
jgi:hypothetical protein